MLFYLLISVLWRMVYLVLFYVQNLRIRYTQIQLGMLHGLHVHFEPFEMNNQQLRPVLDHHLTCSYLLGVTALAKEFIA